MRLYAEVGGLCPKCTQPLLYEKSGGIYKNLEVAHIYPHSPRPDEKRLLEGLARLSADPEHLDNLIPLCPSCHSHFDKPRTREEYVELVNLKAQRVAERRKRESWKEYSLRAEELASIIRALSDFEPAGQLTFDELRYNPQTLEEKLNATMARPVRRNIQHHVQDYFSVIKRAFIRLEEVRPGKGAVIAQQVRTYFLVAASDSVNQTEIYRDIASWLEIKIPSCSIEVAEILAAFFIQNCEVFE